MAEPELSTKAPESDARENPDIPPAAAVSRSSSTSSTSSGPGLGDHCTSSRPTPAGKASTGEIVTLNGVQTYISKPPDYPHSPTRLLLLLPPGTGLLSTNNQIQADLFASAGNYVVVMPDLFSGDPAPNTIIPEDDPSFTPTTSAADASSLLHTIKTKTAEAAKAFMIDMWLSRHTSTRVLPLVRAALDGAREEFADAAARGVYAVGYCFGARYVLLLGKGDGNGIIKAGAMAHPTMVSKGDFEGLKVPLSLVCVEDDPLFPDEVRIAGEEYMSGNGLEHEVQVYPGVPHGFAVVGEYEDPNIKVAQSTAFDQMLKWVKEH